jgi:hypothetical protein
MRLKCTSVPFATSIAAELAAPQTTVPARPRQTPLSRPNAPSTARRRRRSVWRDR